ncbi:SH3 domain-containing protein [Roseofilum casamattae]|uniref:SH3 domain-containing protein n=1 Tax=Roseofilum casamattae BLCC-M143 TaxID=3022442 RepID=A0ABT7C1L6_9CYAN|nr:SH3 domain-containing protein [Roseofilum casamattae]MDJ1185339.1 SH3 domain-containing protein [Roseofilum casamattae BLCC-M143]
MFISFKSPTVVGLGLASLVAALSMEALEDRRSPDRDVETPLFAQSSPEVQSSNSIEPESETAPSTATQVSLTITPESGVTLPESYPQLSSWQALTRTARKPRELEFCLISMAQLSTPKSPMFVRSGPKTDAKIVGELESGRWVGIVGATDGWFEIVDPTFGWVERSDVASGCNEKVERLNLSASRTEIEIADNMVGVSVHRYIANIPPGKTIGLKKTKGSLPKVIDPQGQEIPEFWIETEENSPLWIGQPVESGEYTLEVISYDDRLEYDFSLELLPDRQYAQILSR